MNTSTKANLPYRGASKNQTPISINIMDNRAIASADVVSYFRNSDSPIVEVAHAGWGSDRLERYLSVPPHVAQTYFQNRSQVTYDLSSKMNALMFPIGRERGDRELPYLPEGAEVDPREILKPECKTIDAAFEELKVICDKSDPNTDATQDLHGLEAMEAARKAGQPSWYQMIALLHDLGKRVFKYGVPQWLAVGDTFIAGCPASALHVCPAGFVHNPDFSAAHRGAYFRNTPEFFGVYRKGCGLMNTTCSWSHDEWAYRFFKQNFLDRGDTRIPLEGYYFLRFHSLYSWFFEGDYKELEDDTDRCMRPLVRGFAEFDYYSKEAFSEDKLDYAALRRYAKGLMDEFFGDRTVSVN